MIKIGPQAGLYISIILRLKVNKSHFIQTMTQSNIRYNIIEKNR